MHAVLASSATAATALAVRAVPAPPSASPPGTKPSAPPKATLRQVVAAVFWSFFGVRKGKAMERDAVTVKPLQVIVVGVVLAALLVVALLLVVRLIVANA
jgi:hypothetical protein